MPRKLDAIERASKVQFLKQESISGVEKEKIGKHLFTGTGLSYALSKLNDGAAFSTNRDEVHLSTNVSGAYGVAINRSRMYEDTPAILVLDAHDHSLHIRTTNDSRSNLVSNPIPSTAIQGIYTLEQVRIQEFIGLSQDEQYDLLLEKGIKVPME